MKLVRNLCFDNNVLCTLIQVQLSLCIIYSTGSFFPQTFYGGGLQVTEYKLTFSSATFLLSLGASSFGMAKFYLKGPIPLLPQNAPLGGLLSLKFILTLIIHLLFGARTICLEHALLSSYRSALYDSKEPLIPEEYRLMVYFLPCLISLG